VSRSERQFLQMKNDMTEIKEISQSISKNVVTARHISTKQIKSRHERVSTNIEPVQIK